MIRGDAANSVDAMIAAADDDRPASRLALGSTAYRNISTALAARVEALEGQRAVALRPILGRTDTD